MNRIRTAVIASAGMIAVTALTKGAPATTNAVGPRIHFDKTVYDFGATSMVQQLTGTFTFQNVGDALLELKTPKTSCGCTVASVEPEILKPGEKGALTFTVNLAAFSSGHAEKQITVPSNDATAPSVELTVQTDLTSPVELSPQQIPFGDMRVGATSNLAVLVRRTDGKKLVISRAEAGVSFIHARIEPLEGSSNTSARIWVQAEANGPLRRFVGSVRVYGENPSELLFMVPAFGRVVGDVQVNPEALRWDVEDPEHWPGDQPEAITTRKIRVETTDKGKSLEIKNATSSLKELSVSIMAVKTGRAYEVVARLATSPRQTSSGTIEFESNCTNQPSVVVPVTIDVVEQPVKHEGKPESARPAREQPVEGDKGGTHNGDKGQDNRNEGQRSPPEK